MRKIINISSSSRSRLGQDVLRGSYYGWHSAFARVIAASGRYAVESWAIDVSLVREEGYERDGVRYRIFPTSFSLAPGREFSLPLLRALTAEAATSDTIIHLHDFHNWQTYLIAWRLRHLPIVAHYHGATFFPLQRIRKNWKKIVLLPLFVVENVIERIVLRYVRCFFLPNTRDSALYRRRRYRTVFCPMGVDQRFFMRQDRTVCRQTLGIPADAVVVLVVGGFARQKNVSLAVEAFAAMAACNPGARLYLIGPTYDRSYEVKVRRQIATCSARNRIKIVGMVTREEVNMFYNAADLLLITSREEGGPTVLLEALAVGLPVVSTSVGCVEDMRARGVRSLFVTDASVVMLAAAMREGLAVHQSDDGGAVHSWTTNDVAVAACGVYDELFRTGHGAGVIDVTME